MRIIAGTAKGRKFDALEGDVTRPTSDRVKESLFGILQFKINGARVLDLFSGSGSLAFEALSRGAEFAVANDVNADCAHLIGKNAAAIGMDDRIRVTCLSADKAVEKLASRGESFDFIFLDPPYSRGLENIVLASIFDSGILTEGGEIVIEQDAAGKLDERFEQYVRDRRKYGQTKLTFLTKNIQS